MASFNKVILMGNVTRDIELRYTASGSAVCDIGLAVNRTWFDKQANEKKEEVSFIDCTAFGRTAEVAGEYLTKGKPCLVEGRLKMDSWEDKQTSQKRSKLKVVVESLQLLGGGGGRESAPQQSQASQHTAPTGPPTDSVPF